MTARATLRGVALLAWLAASAPSQAEILEEIVAKVNNSIITRSEFQERLDLYRQQLNRKYAGTELDAKVEDSQETVLHNMVLENLLVQRADVLLDMDKVRRNLLEDFKRQQKIESDEELDRLLKEQKLTRQDLMETLVRLSIPQEIINYEVRRKISVSDREIQEFYDSHRLEFVKPERVSFREIVLLYEEATREEARARAQAVRRELDAGGDFEALVTRESQASSKERGGLVGPFARGELLPEIEKPVFSLQPGEVAGPLESARGFHLVKLETRDPEKVTQLSEARDGISERIRDQKFQGKVEEYLKKLWEDNFIYIFPKYGTAEWKPVGPAGKGLTQEP